MTMLDLLLMRFRNQCLASLSFLQQKHLFCFSFDIIHVLPMFNVQNEFQLYHHFIMPHSLFLVRSILVIKNKWPMNNEVLEHLFFLFIDRKRNYSLFRIDLNKSMVEENLVFILDDVQITPIHLIRLMKVRCGLFNRSCRSCLTSLLSEFYSMTFYPSVHVYR